MEGRKSETLETTENAFASIAALMADARGNALVLPDKVRIRFAADYLRLAARKSAALVELLDAVAKVDKRSGDRAKKRIREIDRDIETFLAVVGKDGVRMLQRHGGKVVMLSGEQAQDLVKSVSNGGEIPKHLLDAPGFEVAPDGGDDVAVENEPSESDGDDHEPPMKPGQDIREDTTLPLECLAYQAWTEMCDLAYRKDGIVGVIVAAAETIQVVNESAEAACDAAPDCDNMQRAMVARYLGMDYLPSVSEELRQLPDGPHYWEDGDGNAVDFPLPGMRLRTAEESRAIGARWIEHFKIYQATQGNVLPGFFKELLNPKACLPQ